MKINAPDKSTSASTQAMQSFAMGIDEAHIAHVIGMLSEQYSNPVLAVIREYAANALDAHREVGSTAPIRVTLPSAFNPELVVEDWGLGLSADEIGRVYGQYGASTKRDSNTQIGGFGIGSKSAFAVADQFTVTAVKDGEQTSVIFARNEGGGGGNIIGQKKVNAPNSVRVTVPVDGDFDAYEREARNLFRFWEPGEVEVVGTEIDFLSDHTITIAPGVHFHKGNGTLRIRMGGIPYALSESDLQYIFPRYNRYSRNVALLSALGDSELDAVLDTPIGSVGIAPARESLKMDPLARETITALLDGGYEAARTYYHERLEEQGDLIKAVRYWIDHRTSLEAFKVPKTWRAKALPLRPSDKISAVAMHFSPTGKTVRAEGRPSWDNMGNRIIIVDTGKEKLEGGLIKDGDSYREVDGPTFALRDGRKGLVRKHAGSMLQALVGGKLPGWKDTFTGRHGYYSRDTDSLVFVLKSQADKDPFINALGPARMTIDEVADMAMKWRMQNRQAGGTSAKRSYSAVTYSVYTKKGRETLTPAEIIAHKNVMYRAENDSLSNHPHSTLEPHLREKYFTKDDVVVVLTNRQNMDTFLERVKQRSKEKCAPAAYRQWYDKHLAKRVGDCSQIELHTIERERDDSCHEIYNEIVRVLRKPGKRVNLHKVVNSEHFNMMLKTILGAANKPLDRSEKQLLDLLHTEVEYHHDGVVFPRAKNGLVEMRDRYPLLRMLATGVAHMDKDEYNTGVLDEAIQAEAQFIFSMIEQIDAAKDTESSDSKASVKKAA